MKRPTPIDPREINQLLVQVEAASSEPERQQRMRALREHCAGAGDELDLLLINRSLTARTALRQAQVSQQELRERLEELTRPPWFTGHFVRVVTTPQGAMARVQQGGVGRVVQLAPGLEPATLHQGDEVFLNSQLNVLMGALPDEAPGHGELALFERRLPDGRLVIKWHDDELLVDAAARLTDVGLEKGDTLRVDRGLGLAFEKVSRDEGHAFFLEDIPELSPELVGGQEQHLEAVIDALTIALIHPEKAARYGQSGRRTILLHGPPGCGKTLMARVSASEVCRRGGRPCRFAVVKPSAWESPWVGETQRNIRDFFAALRRAARDGFAIAFLDEVETVGRIRGSMTGHHSDKFLGSLLAELQGFEQLSGVAVIAATNRKDLVDPALLERLTDLELAVPRPNLRAARTIFGIHLPESWLFSPNGAAAPETRAAIIETAVSRLYSPNADNATCTIRFRDGTERVVHARELVSGRIIEQVCRQAGGLALRREVKGGEAGVRLADMEDALAAQLEKLRTLLTPHNAHAYLTDLPQDLDVVSVRPVVCKTQPRHRLMTEGGGL